MKFEWLRIHKIGTADEQNITLRAKVIGGWIVKSVYVKKLKFKEKRSESLVFVPDPNHEWEITKE